MHTQTQISNCLDENFRFEIVINNDYILGEYSSPTYTFKNLERIAASNFEYWKTIGETNEFHGQWGSLLSKINSAKDYLKELETLDIDQIKYRLGSIFDSQTQRDNKTIFEVTIYSPIDGETAFNKIKKFSRYYSTVADNSFNDAVKQFIRLNKTPTEIGQSLYSTHAYNYYPALYLLRNEFSNIKEHVEDFEKDIIQPLTLKLESLSQEIDSYTAALSKFIEDKNKEIQSQLDNRKQDLAKFKEEINRWQDEKTEKIKILENTYEAKLQHEAPEKLWNSRSREYRKKAKNWTWGLVAVAFLMIVASASAVIFLAEHHAAIQKIVFISPSFFIVALISFLVYIIRIFVKIVMSNHHIASEYEQKAALTRFYQALIYGGGQSDKKESATPEDSGIATQESKAHNGLNINENERLIIISALFGKVDTGLVKTDNTPDLDGVLALLIKNTNK